MIKHASGLLENGASAVVIFTRGSKFCFDKSGSGHSGNWRIRRKKLDQVIIYYAPPERTVGADIYIGKFERIDDAIEPETPENRELRRSVHFTGLKRKGETNANFHEFTGNMRNDFCFIN